MGWNTIEPSSFDNELILCFLFWVTDFKYTPECIFRMLDMFEKLVDRLTVGCALFAS